MGDDDQNPRVRRGTRPTPPTGSFAARMAAHMSAKAEAARETAREMSRRGWSAARLGRAMGYADGTGVSRLLSEAEAVNARLVEALDLFGQEAGVPLVARAGCAQRYAVAALPPSRPPGDDVLAYLAEIVGAVRGAFTRSL